MEYEFDDAIIFIKSTNELEKKIIMPIGVIVNASAVLFGGLIGAFLGDKIPEGLRTALPLTFGAASMGMGVNYIVKLHVLPAVILALILGSAIGELIKLEELIGKLAHKSLHY